MRNVTLTYTAHVDINMTANDWQLYRIDGRDEAAISLNADMKELLNGSSDIDECRLAIPAILNRYSDYGAADSEGYQVANELLVLFFHS